MTIDVDGDVNLCDKNLTKLPLKFGDVTGKFWCWRNKLTTLKGYPNFGAGGFNCSNNKLTSLESCPQYVGGNFHGSFNRLTSLEHCPHNMLVVTFVSNKVQ